MGLGVKAGAILTVGVNLRFTAFYSALALGLKHVMSHPGLVSECSIAVNSEKGIQSRQMFW